MKQSDSNGDTNQMMPSQPSESSDLNSISYSKMLIYLSLVSYLMDITEDFQFNHSENSLTTSDSRKQAAPPTEEFKSSCDQNPLSFPLSKGNRSK